MCFVLLAMIVLLGASAGASMTAFWGIEWAQGRVWLHQYFSPVLSGETVLEVFGNTFMIAAFFAFAEFILGFFSMGQPLCIALLAARGFGIGSAAAQLYIMNGIKAVPAVVVLVLPKAIVLSFIAILGGREMLRLSWLMIRILFRDYYPEESTKRMTRLYCIKFAVLLFMIVIAAAADSTLNYFCSGLY